jgi:hypothetical protein
MPTINTVNKRQVIGTRRRKKLLNLMCIINNFGDGSGSSTPYLLLHSLNLFQSLSKANRFRQFCLASIDLQWGHTLRGVCHIKIIQLITSHVTNHTAQQNAKSTVHYRDVLLISKSSDYREHTIELLLIMTEN